MLRSDLCGFRDAYNVVGAKFAASFNSRKIDYGNNHDPDDLFRNRFFPPGSATE